MCFKRYAIAHGTFWSIGDGRIRTRKNTKKKEKKQHATHTTQDEGRVFLRVRNARAVFGIVFEITRPLARPASSRARPSGRGAA